MTMSGMKRRGYVEKSEGYYDGGRVHLEGHPIRERVVPPPPMDQPFPRPSGSAIGVGWFVIASMIVGTLLLLMGRP